MPVVDDGVADPVMADVLALELGRIVVRAVWVDEICADLAAEYQRAVGEVDRSRLSGESGTRLADALRKAGAAQWADEYLALHSRRNDVVHGLWSADTNHRQMVRTSRGGSYAGAFTVRTWDGDWLKRLAHDLEDFFERARAELFARVGMPEDLSGLPRDG